MVTYDRRASQYRNDKGQFVPRPEITRLLNQEIGRSEARLKAHTRLLTQGKIHLAEWQIRMAETIKTSHLQMAMLSSGGKEQLTPRHYGAIGSQLRKQFEYLDNFARDLYAGKVTPTQAIRRSGLYAESVKITFSRAEQISRIEEGFNAGKRILDAGARHCSECIDYQRLEWTAIADIIPVGTNCSCQNRCKCRIVFARIGRTLTAIE
jgi:hypothetical protein